MKITISKQSNIYWSECMSNPPSFDYFVINYKDKSKIVGSEEELFYFLLVELGINVHKDDLKRIPFNFPIDLEDLIRTSKHEYTSLTPKVQYNSLPETKSTAFATVDK